MPLKTYQEKEHVDVTPEPAANAGQPAGDPIFVIQEHQATSLHYDFRLESDGVLKSWAVTKEPTLDPLVRRLAFMMEDSPLAYADVSGDIPDGEHGAGHVKIWDRGTFRNVAQDGTGPMTIEQSIDAGHVMVELRGEKLKGIFSLMRLKAGGGRRWLFIKKNDASARPGTADDTADGVEDMGDGNIR